MGGRRMEYVPAARSILTPVVFVARKHGAMSVSIVA